MKKTLMTISALAIAAMMMASCGGASNSNTNSGDKPCEAQCDSTKKCDKPCDKPCGDSTATSTTSSVDLSKKYVCPNRDGASDNPGVCEACGMDLIEN